MTAATKVAHPLSLLLMLTLLHASSPAHAQPDRKAAAREAFDRGVEAFKDKRFGEAADEFDAAYKLSPAFQVLYNIGQVSVALGRSVEAVDAFEGYLKQGGSAIPPARQREVQREIAKQLARVGSVAIRTVPEGAEVRVDGRLLDKTPLQQPVRLTAGKHTIEALLAGHAPQIRDVDVTGRNELTVALTLEAVVAARAEA